MDVRAIKEWSRARSILKKVERKEVMKKSLISMLIVTLIYVIIWTGIELMIAVRDLQKQEWICVWNVQEDTRDNWVFWGMENKTETED